MVKQTQSLKSGCDLGVVWMLVFPQLKRMVNYHFGQEMGNGPHLQGIKIKEM